MYSFSQPSTSSYPRRHPHTLIYRIRPRDEKHPVLLPVGEKAQFRIHKDKMLLRVEDADGKEREYSVVSMTPRQDRKSAENNPPK